MYNKSEEPLISVVLPVYNAALYIEESIKSILDQTYKKFELIILDDGSRDNSAELIKNIKDDRIRFYSHPNMGLAKTLNKGIELANGEFIARQDADDVSLPERFERQVLFLITNPDVNLLGTWAEIIPVKNNIHRFHKHPAKDSVLKFELFFDCPFVHTSVMIRKNWFKSNADFYNTGKLVEDFDLWSRIARNSNIANIPEVLVKYRELDAGLSKMNAEIFLSKVVEQSIENIIYVIPDKKYAISQMVSLYHGLYSTFNGKISIQEITRIISMLVNKVIEKNAEEKKAIKKRAAEIIKLLRSRKNVYEQLNSKNSMLVKYYYKLINKIQLTVSGDEPNILYFLDAWLLNLRNYRIWKRIFKIRKSIFKELRKGKFSYGNILSKSFISLLDNREYTINVIIPFYGRAEFYKPIMQSFNNAIEYYYKKYGKEGNTFCLTFIEQSPEKTSQKYFENKTNYIWTPGNSSMQFNKGLAYNFAVKYSNKAKYYLLHDLDILIKENFFDELFSNLKENKCLQTYCKRRVLYLSRWVTKQVLNGEIDYNKFSEQTPGISPPGILGSPGGSILVEHDLFWQVGGFDPELFWGYAPEDIMFWEKIVTLYGEPAYADNPPVEIFHMWHPPTNQSNPLLGKMNDLFLQFKKMNRKKKLKFIELQKNNFSNKE